MSALPAEDGRWVAIDIAIWGAIDVAAALAGWGIWYALWCITP